MNLIGHLNRLETTGLIRPAATQPELEYLFRHALVQDAAYASLVKHDRRRLHRSVAETLERLHPDRVEEFAPLLARHFDEAGDDERALKYFRLAGDAAFRVYANAEAVMHYTGALDIARRTATDAEQIGHLYARRGRALELSSQFEAALRNYEEMEAYACGRGDLRMEFEAVMARATIHNTANTAHDPVRGQALLERARALAHELQDGGAEAKILWNLLLLNTMRGGSVAQRIGYGEQALALARELDLREQMGFALTDLWFGYAGAGEWTRGRQALAEARTIWHELGNLTMLCEATGRTSLTHLVLGEYHQAIAYFEESRRLAETIGSVDMQALCRFMIGFVYLERGEFGTAISIMKQAIDLGEQTGNVSVLIGTRADLGWAYGLLGAYADGLELVRQARAVAEANFFMMHQWPAAHAVELKLLQGDLVGAEAAKVGLQNYRDLKTQLGYMPFLWVRVALAEGSYSFATGDYARTVTVIDDLLADLREAGLRFMLPDALALKGRALISDGRADDAHDVLLEARAAAEALGSRRSLLPILMTLSEIEAQRGNQAEAEARRRQARQITEYIADHLGSPDRRASFLNLPQVRQVAHDQQ